MSLVPLVGMKSGGSLRIGAEARESEHDSESLSLSGQFASPSLTEAEHTSFLALQQSSRPFSFLLFADKTQESDYWYELSHGWDIFYVPRIVKVTFQVTKNLLDGS